MKSKAQFEKWASVGLGVVCLILVLNLVFRGGFKAGSPKPAAPAVKPPPGTRARAAAAPASRSGDELARYNPVVRLDLLEEIQKRADPKVDRDPFEFVAKAPPPKPAGTVAAAAAPVTPAPPPPPPPPPLKAVGYTEKGGVREAIVTLEDQVFVIHEGETFAKRFQVIRITPSQVEINDATTQQNIRLPFS